MYVYAYINKCTCRRGIFFKRSDFGKIIQNAGSSPRLLVNQLAL